MHSSKFVVTDKEEERKRCRKRGRGSRNLDGNDATTDTTTFDNVFSQKLNVTSKKKISKKLYLGHFFVFCRSFNKFFVASSSPVVSNTLPTRGSNATREHEDFVRKILSYLVY